MPDDHNDAHKLRELDHFIDRYLSYWLLVCLVVSVFVGWGAIVAWVGLVLAMNAFRDVVFESKRIDPKKPRKK